MGIPVKCPSCGKLLQAKESVAGRQARCPDCDSVMVIPFSADPQAAREFQERERLEFVADDNFISEHSSATSGQPRKPCPACGEMIAQAAVKCRFCGEDILGAPSTGLRRPNPDSSKRSEFRDYSRSANLPDDDLSPLDLFLCICTGGIGLLVGFIYMIQGKSKGGRMMGISICSAMVLGLIFAVIASILGA